MFHSLKAKLILALTSLISVALLLGGGIIIYQNVEQLREDIYLNALDFSELTNDRIVSSFEDFYVSDNFLQYRKVVNPLLGENIDISRIELIGKSGELFYDSETESDVAYIGLERKQSYDIERSRDIKPSLLFSNGDIIYVKKSPDNKWLAVNSDDVSIGFPSGEVKNIVFPHRNARIAVAYTISYAALSSRIIQMIISISAVIFSSILLVSFFAISFANRLVAPIKELEKGVIKIGEGNFGSQVKIMSKDEIGVLAKNFNMMSKKLKKDTKELLEKEKLTKELDIARSIQQNMLPEKPPKLKYLDVSGKLSAATQIGGDVYDYIQTDNNGAYIFIADVTGHGVPAGMVANITHSSLYSFSSVYSETDKIMKSMNKVVHAKTQPNMFATAMLAYWDDKKRKIRYCNAGHEEILYYDAKKDELSLIGKGGMALGMVSDAENLFKEKSMPLSRGDVIIFYTDGIPEAWKNENENLGMEAFKSLVNDVLRNNNTAKSIRDGILNMVTEYRHGYVQQDDITLIVLRGL